MTNVPKLLRVAEVAELTGIEKWRLYDLLKSGEGPRYMRIGKIYRISEAALVEWIEARHQANKEEEER